MRLRSILAWPFVLSENLVSRSFPRLGSGPVVSLDTPTVKGIRISQVDDSDRLGPSLTSC